MEPRIEAIIQTMDGRWLRLEDPIRIVKAQSPGGVMDAIADVERLTRDEGYHAAGFVSYEAGAAFGLRVRESDDRLDEASDLPLVWFGLFEARNVHPIGRPCRSTSYELGPLVPSLDRERFGAAFGRIREELAAGDTYQVNLTFRMEGPFAGDPLALFADLVEAQQGRYSAFLETGGHAICSASPELFFSLDGLTVTARPMKGTMRRGRTLEEDRLRQEALRSSAKERAENVMIVDMVRNDLGRIADVGSVAVPELFVVERYPNVWQMTSLVTAQSQAPLTDLFAALHPSASVTGAPKIRTMEILRSLEEAPRGVYTGAIGYIRPDGSAHFNVAIRTAVVDHRQQRVEFGVGSGIVWDSDPEAEYDECLLKGSVLGQRPVGFDLLETLRWTREGGFFLLERHVQRVTGSAEYFGFPCAREAIEGALENAVAGHTEPLRVRLLVASDGAVQVECAPFVATRVPLEVALAGQPIDVEDRFLFHKTTDRAVYDRARRPEAPGGPGVPGVDDVILWNAKGQVTEATTANLVVELDGALVTPPVGCGLLAGTYRAELLARGRIGEGVVTIDRLRAASRFWLINSVHEWREAVLREAR